MFDSLFGTEPSVAKFVIAFVAVIGLIALTAWLVRRFGASRLGGNAARGRQPRLAVIDAAPVDGRRRLVLIRRDNIEHLLMIGGPSDVVVEANIVRAATRETGRGPSVEPARTLPVETGTSWPLQPSPEPAPVIPPAPIAARNLRASFEDHGWTASEPAPAREPAPPREPPLREPPPLREVAAPRPRPDSLTGMAADLSAKLNPPDKPTPPSDLPSFGRTAPAPEPVARSAPPVEPVRREAEPERGAKPDHNLAEMASRLEAALRRPPSLEGRPPVTDPLAVAPAEHAVPQPKAPEVKMPEVAAPAREAKAPEAAAAAPAKDNKAAAKSIYDNLEQEMASLLGRPATKQ